MYKVMVDFDLYMCPCVSSFCAVEWAVAFTGDISGVCLCFRGISLSYAIAYETCACVHLFHILSLLAVHNQKYHIVLKYFYCIIYNPSLGYRQVAF